MSIITLLSQSLKKISLVSSLILLITNVSYAKNNVSYNENTMAAVNEAKMITKTFVTTLKAELKKAMIEGGPLKAIDVCNTKALPITAQVAKEHNAKLSRVSLKNRNPQNKPSAWQKKILENFDTRAAQGEDIKKMAYSEIVEHNGKKQLRFMKAMPTGDGCLVCHGKNIAPSIKDKLATLYPNDKATGYEKGQVRGAIVILKNLN